MPNSFGGDSTSVVAIRDIWLGLIAVRDQRLSTQSPRLGIIIRDVMRLLIFLKIERRRGKLLSS